ncbi:nucleotidyl transferase AbiEii/AbiGii toxin family protein [Clostridium swellfunianum]|uniref:nucleotidyl transferase AbiEii/AbiGii toxin family protein n=1 Tax=Clostridium swellfunianum TaxID=1367462 RepID=UPI00202E857A|nr:nucleotidyl transferase AbiEii/AbiGii toxin family protein [Clostridium swellfunianum]MCM0647079.1 nucleotidyl transferase AbiEii/AbiGii toxin family protein [Clostridium swellfunianum]
MGRKASIFTHPFDYFTKHHIKSYAKEKDIIYKDNLESHIWIYELHSQIQKRCGDRVVLKGGASAQIHLPVNLQRLSNDIDCATDLSRRDLFDVMKDIRESYIKAKFYTSYEEYIPKSIRRDGRTIPMMTFIYDVPFVYQTKMRQRYPGMKLDFLFLDTKALHAVTLKSAETIGLKLKYNPICIDKYSTTSDKLLTLATHTLGLEANKLDALYKNIYDLSCLLKVVDDIESFKIIAERLKESIQHEIEVKNAHNVTTEDFFKDLLSSIFYLSLTNMSTEYNRILLNLAWFSQQTLPGETRSILSADLWSILSLHLYVWIYSLGNYILSKDYSRLIGIDVILSEYEYYITLFKKERRKYKAELKRRILEKEPSLNVDATGNPLRLMYLDYILTYCDIRLGY